MSIWAELKRRNVVRVAAAYLVACWVLIEVASLLFEAFGFPPSTLKILISILGLGLLPMLVFSWVYELTPDGLVRDAGPGHENPENAHTARRLDQVTIAMILLALAVVVVQRFVVPERIVQVDTPTAVAASTEPTVPEITKPMPPLALPSGPSVAVLPFANMSSDPDNVYFADGISEEILNVLAGVEGLKVASRTSAFSFKETSLSIAEIASQLGVAHILEGSVRKQGVRVRITAQLIDAANDTHLWSDTYDRELTDIFAVQEEIAQSITEALGDALGVQTVSVEAMTENLEAYGLYLRGRSLFYQRGSSLTGARAALEQAVSLDPEFAEAWAMLAATAFVTPSYLKVSTNEAMDTAKRAAERARSLDESLAMPYAVLGQIRDFDGDLLATEALLNVAIERQPDNLTARLWRGIFYVGVGKFDAAEKDLRHAYERDPLVGINNGWLGIVQVMRGENAEADALLKRSLELGWSPVIYLGFASMADVRGDKDVVRQNLRKYPESWVNYRRSSDSVAEAWLEALDDPEKLPKLNEIIGEDVRKNPEARWGLALLWAGDYENGLRQEIDLPYLANNSFMAMMWMPPVRAAAERPLFLQLAEQRGLLAYWNKKGFPEGCQITEQPERHLECAW